MRCLRGLPLCVLLVVALAARAAAAGDDDVPEDVLVRGSQSGGFSTSAGVDDSPREITDAASLIDPMPGVHVRRLGADDGFATLSIRGSSSNEVAFYFAGVPLLGGSDPTVDLSTLPLWPGSRARVYRSFAPATLGPGSLGGTLQLDPPSASGPARTETWSAAGSFGAMRLRAGDVRDLGGGVRLATGLSAARADDDFTYIDPLVPGATRVRLNAGFAEASGLASASVPMKLGRDRTGYLHVTTLLQAREQGLPGTIFAPTPSQRLRTDRELATAAATLPYAPGVFSVQIWGLRQGADFRDGDPLPGFGASLEKTTITQAGGAFGWRRVFGPLRASVRLDARGERYAPGAYIGPTLPIPATRVAGGAGADLSWRPWRHVELAASGRVDAWVDGSAATPAPQGDVRPTGHAGVEVSRGPWTFAAHGGVTARPANFVERFGTPGGFVATPDLKPESAVTGDAGVRFHERWGAFTLGAEIDGFATRADDLILFVPVGAERLLKAENISQATLAGAELDVAARFRGLRLRGAYTGLFTQNDGACYSGACPPLPGRPAHDVVADVSYTLGPLTVRYGLDGLFGTHFDQAGTIEVPPRVLQSAGVRLDVPGVRGVRLALDVRNLFDVRAADYANTFDDTRTRYPIGDVYFYPLPGRSFLLSLRIDRVAP